MSFAIQLAADRFPVDPGASSPVAIEVANRTDSAETYEIIIEGLDPEWTAVPAPTFRADAREIVSERFFLKPPKESQSVAGAYPFVVRVRSLESGESKTAQAILEIKPYHHVSVDVQPRKGSVSPFSKQTRFQVTVMNLGNSEQSMQLFASDPDDLFAFDFSADQVTIGPGHQKSVDLTVTITKSPLLSNSRLQNFTLSARSVSNPSVAASAQGQIEQRALATPGTLIMFLTAVALAALWYLYLPKPPLVDSFQVTPTEALVGQQVVIRWQTSRANSVRLKIGERTYDKLQPDGEWPFTPDFPGEFVVSVTAMEGQRFGTAQQFVLVVNKPPEIPEPVIETFVIEPTPIQVGQEFLVKYKFNDAVVKATLFPNVMTLDPRGNSIQLTARIDGDVTYRIVAENSAGKSVEKSLTVKSVIPSLAKVIKFDASPGEVDSLDGRVTISWQLTQAVRAEIRYKGQSLEVDPAAGKRDFLVTEDTTFTLVGFDSNARTVSQEIRVTVKKLPGDPPNDSAPATAGTAGGGD